VSLKNVDVVVVVVVDEKGNVNVCVHGRVFLANACKVPPIVVQ
jgi:hypothetical protein